MPRTIKSERTAHFRGCASGNERQECQRNETVRLRPDIRKVESGPPFFDGKQTNRGYFGSLSKLPCNLLYRHMLAKSYIFHVEYLTELLIDVEPEFIWAMRRGAQSNHSIIATDIREKMHSSAYYR